MIRVRKKDIKNLQEIEEPALIGTGPRNQAGSKGCTDKAKEPRRMAKKPKATMKEARNPRGK